MAEPGLRRLPDWLILAQEEWDEVERRNQLLVRALAARHPRARFLFAELPLRPRGVRRWRRPRPRAAAPGVWCVRTVRPFPGRGRLDELNDRIEAHQLRRALRRLGIDRPALWTQDPRAATLLDRLPVERLVYDLTDDWAAFERDPARRAAVQARIESLAARADVVFACSRPLERGARAWSERVEYLPNAVEPPSPAGPAPPDLRRLPRPVVGYVGTLHSSRLDVALLARVAELRPAWSLALLGPDQLDAPDRERLLGAPNVHHLGVRPHAAVRAYIEGMDVCLVPHLVDDFTRSLDPLKLYEYLAAGRPVVSTPTGNAPELREHIATAAGPEEMVAEVERACAEDSPERAEARRAVVRGATWEDRARQIERALGAPARDVDPPANAGAAPARVSAVVVSHQTRELLERCLSDLRGQAGVELQTLVVDNASTDGSADMVRERFPEVELVELSDNVGFAGANNLAFGRCRGDYVLLLNSDAFLDPGALAELVAAARRNPRAGAVGPRLHNPDGTLQRSAWPFPRAGRLVLEALMLHRPLRRVGLLEDLGTWRHDEERVVDFLIGACLLLRTDALAEVGGFDEGFWLYGEEADLQRRLASRGFEVVFTPRATATHVGGASSAVSATRLRHFYRGQRRFLQKHGGVLAWPIARAALLAGSLLRGRLAAARVAVDRRL